MVSEASLISTGAPPSEEDVDWPQWCENRQSAALIWEEADKDGQISYKQTKSMSLEISRVGNFTGRLFLTQGSFTL